MLLERKDLRNKVRHVIPLYTHIFQSHQKNQRITSTKCLLLFCLSRWLKAEKEVKC